MDAILDSLRLRFEGQKALVVGGPAAGLLPLVRQLRQVGAAPPLGLANGRGVGELPDGLFEAWVAAESGDGADGTLQLGNGTTGGFLMITFDRGAIPVGESIAPWTKAAYELADEQLGTKIGAVEAAPELR